MSGKAAAAVAAPRFQSALRKLAEQGVKAMRPSRRVYKEAGTQRVVNRGPAISGRVENVLRKIAIKEGTYGSFDPETLKGWDPQWDIDLAVARARGNGRIRIKVPKTSMRFRNREERAQKIEKALVGMDERMEKYHADIASKRVKYETLPFMEKLKKLKSRKKK